MHLLKEILQYASAVVQQWIALMSGLVAVLFDVRARTKGQPGATASPRGYRWAAGICLLWATFGAWRDVVQKSQSAVASARQDGRLAAMADFLKSRSLESSTAVQTGSSFSGTFNVTGGANQFGNNNTMAVTITNGPEVYQAKVETSYLARNEPVGSNFCTRVRMHIVSPHPVSLLRIMAVGETLFPIPGNPTGPNTTGPEGLRFVNSVNGIFVGMASFSLGSKVVAMANGRPATAAYLIIPNASGDYDVTARTTNADNVQFLADVQ